MYKNTLLAAKGGCICTPLTPPKSATVYYAKLFPEKLWLTKSQYRTFVAHLERGVEEDGLQLS